MTHVLEDDRQPGWFYLDNAILDEYGAQIGVIGIAVYAYIARRANRNRVSWPSYTSMATALGLSRPSVIAAVKSLAAHGLIGVETVKDDGKRPYNRYTLLKIKAIGKPDLPVLVNDVDCNKTQLTRPIEQDTREIPPKPPASRFTQEFEEWWAACPTRMRRCGKGEAYTAWRKANGNRPPLAEMLRVLAIQRESHDWQKEGGQYVPMATTYLNKGRWEADASAFTESAPPARSNGRASPAEKTAQTRDALAHWYLDSEGLDAESDVHSANGTTGEPLRARVDEAAH